MDQIYLVFWSDLRRIEEWDSFAYNCLALWIRGNNLLLVLWIASFLSMFDITSSSLVWTYWPLLYHDQFSLLYQKRHVVMTYLSSQYHISFFRLQLQTYESLLHNRFVFCEGLAGRYIVWSLWTSGGIVEGVALKLEDGNINWVVKRCKNKARFWRVSKGSKRLALFWSSCLKAMYRWHTSTTPPWFKSYLRSIFYQRNRRKQRYQAWKVQINAKNSKKKKGFVSLCKMKRKLMMSIEQGYDYIMLMNL